MDVLVNAVSGPGKGHRFTLRDAQVVTVGRTGWADYAVPEDLKISGKHASLEVKGQFIVLVDLGSTNGTWYQDQAITQASLQPGQSFVLGDTTFEIEPIAQESPGPRMSKPGSASESLPGHPTGGFQEEDSPIRIPVGPGTDEPAIILDSAGQPDSPRAEPPSAAPYYPASDEEGPAIIIPDDDMEEADLAGDVALGVSESSYESSRDESPTNSPLVIGASHQAAEPPVPMQLRDSAQMMPATHGEQSFTVTPCPSGWVLHRSILPEDSQPLKIAPDALLRKLFPTSTIFALVHFQNFGAAVPEECNDAEPLFQWVSDLDLARQVGPVILESQKHPTMGEWLKQGWGQDAVICIATSDSERLRPHLLKLITKNVLVSEGKGGSLFGYCWPSILSGLLELQNEVVIDRMFPKYVEAVLIEIPGTEGGWQLFTRKSQVELLQSAGLIEQSEEPLTR